MRKIKNHLGEEVINKESECIKIIEYRTSYDIDILFVDTGEVITNCLYSQFKHGNIVSRLKPTVYGVGIIGNEKTRDENHDKIKSYIIWTEMIRRCYSEKEWNNPKNKSYEGCKICDEWLMYSNFKKWYDDNLYEIEGERICIDKDILEKGNKIYCPEKCIFVPNNINVLFTNSKCVRGDYPVGVTYHKRDNKYIARSCDGSKKRVYLGKFNTPEAAFQSYKTYKEKLIKQIADNYKDKIPLQLYQALYRYEVEITD